jgi:hypothetical protein
MQLGSLPVAFVLGFACLTGCKADQSMPDASEPTTNESLSTTSRGQQGIEMLTLFISEQNGLAKLIEENSQPLKSDEASQRLASESILIRILHEEGLARVLSSLEESGAAQNIWCGQMMEWRDLLEHRMQNQLMTLNGDLLLFKEGKLTIGARGWIEPSIEGVRTRVELVPRHIPDRPETPSLVRRNKVVPHFFDVASVQTELEPGQILLITCTAPPQIPRAEESQDNGDLDDQKNSQEADLGENNENAPADDKKTSVVKRKRPIQSLGHIMFMTPSLSSERRAQRTALLLIPRIPQKMLPQQYETPKRTQENR